MTIEAKLGVEQRERFTAVNDLTALAQGCDQFVGPLNRERNVRRSFRGWLGKKKTGHHGIEGYRLIHDGGTHLLGPADPIVNVVGLLMAPHPTFARCTKAHSATLSEAVGEDVGLHLRPALSSPRSENVLADMHREAASAAHCIQKPHVGRHPSRHAREDPVDRVATYELDILATDRLSDFLVQRIVVRAVDIQEASCVVHMHDV